MDLYETLLESDRLILQWSISTCIEKSGFACQFTHNKHSGRPRNDNASLIQILNNFIVTNDLIIGIK